MEIWFRYNAFLNFTLISQIGKNYSTIQDILSIFCCNRYSYRTRGWMDLWIHFSLKCKPTLVVIKGAFHHLGSLRAGTGCCAKPVTEEVWEALKSAVWWMPLETVAWQTVMIFKSVPTLGTDHQTNVVIISPHISEAGSIHKLDAQSPLTAGVLVYC